MSSFDHASMLARPPITLVNSTFLGANGPFHSTQPASIKSAHPHMAPKSFDLFEDGIVDKNRRYERPATL